MFWITALAFVMAAALAKLGAAPVAVAVLSAALWSSRGRHRRALSSRHVARIARIAFAAPPTLAPLEKSRGAFLWRSLPHNRVTDWRTLRQPWVSTSAIVGRIP